MAKVFIPQVGDKIELSSNWNCKIFNEHRNRTVFDALGVDVSNMPNSNIDITFPKGTVFKSLDFMLEHPHLLMTVLLYLLFPVLSKN